MVSPQDATAGLGRQLATSALSLARSGADPDAAAVVLLGVARGNRAALELARARCQAAVDQDVTDRAAQKATAMLTAALDDDRA